MYIHKDIAAYIYKYKNRHKNQERNHQIYFRQFTIFNLTVWCFFSLLRMTRWSTVQTQLKVRLLSCEQINTGTIQSDTFLSLPICEPSIAHPCLPGQPVNHRPPLSQGIQEKRVDGVGGKEEEMRLDGGLKLPEITTEPLQLLETINTISWVLGCRVESWPQFCSQWLKTFSFAFVPFISVSK